MNNSHLNEEDNNSLPSENESETEHFRNRPLTFTLDDDSSDEVKVGEVHSELTIDVGNNGYIGTLDAETPASTQALDTGNSATAQDVQPPNDIGNSSTVQDGQPFDIILSRRLTEIIPTRLDVSACKA